jgi:hypothetical protein
VWIGWLEFDLLLGDVHSLKQKRSVVRPIIAELQRRFSVSAAAALSSTTRWRASAEHFWRSSASSASSTADLAGLASAGAAPPLPFAAGLGGGMVCNRNDCQAVDEQYQQALRMLPRSAG